MVEKVPALWMVEILRDPRRESALFLSPLAKYVRAFTIGVQAGICTTE